MRWSAMRAGSATGWAIPSRCGSSRRHRLREPCGSKCCRKGTGTPPPAFWPRATGPDRGEGGAAERPVRRRRGARRQAPIPGRGTIETRAAIDEMAGFCKPSGGSFVIRKTAARFGRRSEAALPKRPMWRSLRRGLLCRCPACGQGKIFRAFLKVADHCPACGEDLSHHRADDAPAYFVILVVGHVVVPLALMVEVTLFAALLAARPAVAAADHRSRDRPAAARQGRDRRRAMGEPHARLRPQCGGGGAAGPGGAVTVGRRWRNPGPGPWSVWLFCGA